MREIKFRAWIKHTNEMVLDVSYNKDYEEDVNPWVYMQYTGLEDMNDKMIFEGDIVNIHYLSGEPLKGVIIFDFLAWQIKGGGLLSSFHNDTLEIIANIYENPELLK